MPSPLPTPSANRRLLATDAARPQSATLCRNEIAFEAGEVAGRAVCSPIRYSCRLGVGCERRAGDAPQAVSLLVCLSLVFGSRSSSSERTSPEAGSAHDVGYPCFNSDSEPTTGTHFLKQRTELLLSDQCKIVLNVSKKPSQRSLRALAFRTYENSTKVRTVRQLTPWSRAPREDARPTVRSGRLKETTNPDCLNAKTRV
jgi:hypothetical protein